MVTPKTSVTMGNDISHFLAEAAADPLHRALFPERGEDALKRRIPIWEKLQTVTPRPAEFSVLEPLALWSYPLALAQYIYEKKYQIVGIAGPSGVGKTTLARLVRVCLRCWSPQSCV